MIAALTLAACAVAVLARTAYRRGRRRDARRLPPALGSELRMHKLECLGEPPARVDLELRLLLGEGPAERGAMATLHDLRDRFARAASLTGRRGTAARRW